MIIGTGDGKVPGHLGRRLAHRPRSTEEVTVGGKGATTGGIMKPKGVAIFHAEGRTGILSAVEVG